MQKKIVKELSEKYNKEEIFIQNIIQITINKGYEFDEAKKIVENYLKTVT